VTDFDSLGTVVHAQSLTCAHTFKNEWSDGVAVDAMPFTKHADGAMGFSPCVSKKMVEPFGGELVVVHLQSIRIAERVGTRVLENQRNQVAKGSVCHTIISNTRLN